MKEQLYTIPLNDAINANDECPFCFIERSLEQDSLDFVLGSCASYMESDVRAVTDAQGFCRDHFKKMFNYGNTLGNGWILKTHFMKVRSELDEEIKRFQPSHRSLMDKLKKKTAENNLVNWVNGKKESCYICKRSEEIYARYIDTFFVMWKKDPAFAEKVKNSKGFCLTHFGDLCAAADEKLSDKEQTAFYDTVLPLMQENLARLQEDVNWLIDKFDYRNADADWKTSKDAIQRGMQKLKGGYPADAPLKAKK